MTQPVQANAGERLGRLAGVLDREVLRPIDPAVALPALREGVVALDIAPRPELERCLGRRQPRDLSAMTRRIVTCIDLEGLPAPEGAAAELAIARLLVGQTGFAADSVISPEEMAVLRGEGAPGIIGLALIAGPDAILVHQAMPGGTAQAAGIGQGWAVLAIDGQPHAPADLAQAVQALRGETGSEVTLVLRDPAGVEHQMVLERVAREAVFPVPVARRDGSVLELAITEFAFGTSQQARALVAREPRGLERIVLDLRGNTGGALEEAIMLADLFLDTGTIAEIRGRQSTQDVYRANRDAIAPGTELVVLVDGVTASGAELVAAALVDNGRASLVGAPTFGTGTIRTLIMLDRDMAATITTAQIIRANGTPLEGHPLVPDCANYAAASLSGCGPAKDVPAID